MWDSNSQPPAPVNTTLSTMPRDQAISNYWWNLILNSILQYSILFYAFLYYSILYYSILFYSVYSILYNVIFKLFEENENVLKRFRTYSFQHQATPLYPQGHKTHPLAIFSQIDQKLSVHKHMNLKINTNRRYILNPSNRRKKTSIDLKI